jgi:hypothetical protein
MTKYMIVNAYRDPLVRYGIFDSYKDAELVVKRIWADEGYEVYVEEKSKVDKHVDLWRNS